MNQLNSVIIEGNVVRDVELRTVVGDKKLCSINIATNRYLSKPDGTFTQNTSYFDVDCWERLAEISSSQAKKGRGIRVVGRLVQDTWTDKDGKNCSKVKILAEHIEFKSMSEKPVVSESTKTVEKKQKTETFDISF